VNIWISNRSVEWCIIFECESIKLNGNEATRILRAFVVKFYLAQHWAHIFDGNIMVIL